MPLERVSQGFKDISMTFQSNTLNGDIIGIKMKMRLQDP